MKGLTSLSFAEISNKALRKWNSEEFKVVSFDFKKYDYKTREKPTKLGIKETLTENKSAKEIKYIIEWFLDRPRKFEKPKQLNITMEDIDQLYRMPNGVQLAEDYLHKTKK